MRLIGSLSTAVLAILLIAAPAVADSFTLTSGGASHTSTASSGNLSGSATFSLNADILSITLTNTSPSDVLVPADVLTSLFFSITGNPTLTPLAAVLPGSSQVFFGPNGGGNLGGEFAYANNLFGAPGGLNQGISGSGFGLFGAANFNGPDLDPPAAVNGGNYGIVSAGDNLVTGNAGVTGNVPLIKNSVAFTLLAPFSSLSFTGVAFQYGTSLADPCIGDCRPPQLAPEPSSVLLLGSGLAGLAFLKRKRAQARK